MSRVSFIEMKSEIVRVLSKRGFTPERAEACAQLFAEASLDGVYSHGLNRVPRFVDYIEKGFVQVHAEPTRIDGTGLFERYDGNLGPGNLNAKFCMNRAIQIAAEHGIGVVTVRNTNHWMRGGSYGWQAANAGMVGVCWTNTESCMPSWGSKQVNIGNNPFVLAIPRNEGHVVLDMAMSQFSYGKLEVYKLENTILPFDGGFDSEGNLTRDPSEIEKTMRILPTGYWKGSGLSIMLDIMAATLSGGLSTYHIDVEKPGLSTSGYRCSQVFIVFDPVKFSGQSFMEQTVEESIRYLHQSIPAEEGNKITYPGERTLETRRENLEKGIPVNDRIWSEILSL